MSTAASAKLVYTAVNQPVLEAVPATAERILDVGCGTGLLGRAIKQIRQAHVTGLTYSEEEAANASGHLDQVVTADLNRFDPSVLGTYDCIICSHVLEHLYWPDQFLTAIRPHLAPTGKLIVALPNVLAWRQRLTFLAGRFRYTDGGLMDRTHFRFYDRTTASRLVADAGYRVVESRAFGVFPLSRFLFGLRKPLDRLAATAAPGLFGWQFVVTAETVPNTLEISSHDRR